VRLLCHLFLFFCGKEGTRAVRLQESCNFWGVAGFGCACFEAEIVNAYVFGPFLGLACEALLAVCFFAGF